MPRKRSKSLYCTAVLDIETDPFLEFRVPKPFCAGFYFWSGEDATSEVYFDKWGPNCIAELVAEIEAEAAHRDIAFRIYAHNGGKFDFHYLIDWIPSGPHMRIINGRITEANFGSRHKLQDSFAIMPFALAAYAKTPIEYDKFEKHEREKPKNKREIRAYLRDDCAGLFELVHKNIQTFGHKLTVGSTAMGIIKQMHPFTKMSPTLDAQFRRFYHGGRTQCFEAGELAPRTTEKWKVYDVNSMYPKAMRDFKHPANSFFMSSARRPDDYSRPYFLRFKGYSYGALPMKTEDGYLEFPYGEGEFYACSHELEVAERYNLVRIDEVIECHVAMSTIDFREYVDTYYELKSSAKLQGDKAMELFAKFLLNAGYGKFSTNPDHFKEWFLDRDGGMNVDLLNAGWSPYHYTPTYTLYAKPTKVHPSHYYDVSIAASITSAARAILLEAIQLAIRPVYCDTDSLICEGGTFDIDEYRLGAWKLEIEADRIAIGGKKLYALYNHDGSPLYVDKKTGKPVLAKIASKGGRLTPQQIKHLATTDDGIEYVNPVPMLGIHRFDEFDTERNFVKRIMKKTYRELPKSANPLLRESVSR